MSKIYPISIIGPNTCQAMYSSKKLSSKERETIQTITKSYNFNNKPEHANHLKINAEITEYLKSIKKHASISNDVWRFSFR